MKEGMKTIRRDWLKRQIESGNMVCRCDFRFVDGYPQSEPQKDWIPCFVGEYKDHVEGRIMFYDHCFKSKSGYCWANEDGTISFSVHSNAHYTLIRAGVMRTLLFFSPSLKAACAYVKAVCEKEGYFGSLPHCLPKDRQVSHAEEWYTFEAKIFRV